MSSVTNQAKLTIVYEDATSRIYNLPDLTDDATAPNIMRAKIKAINANMPTNFSTTFISENKAPAARIGKAQIISSEEEVIYDATS